MDGMEDLEQTFENKIGNILSSTNVTSNTENDDDIDEHAFDNFDDTFMSNDEKYIKSSRMCKKILYISICEGSTVRAWDVLLLLPNLTFLVFLIMRWSANRRKLLATNSLVFRTFHAIVGTVTALSFLRGVISMSIAGAETHGSQNAMIADKICWIILKFVIVMSEIIIIIIGIAGAKIDSQKAMKKVFAISSIISLIFHISESAFEFRSNDGNFIVHLDTSKFSLYGFGGSAFCMSSSACFAVIYGFVLVMPLIPYVKQTMAMPNKPGFYQYCTFLLILYIVRFIGAAFIFFEANPNGLCLVNLTTFLYLTFYSPFVYSAFLSPFFRTAQPTLLFSYKAHVDDIDDDEIQNSGSMQFSLDQSPVETVESQPIVRNGAQPFVGLASPDSIIEDHATDALRY